LCEFCQPPLFIKPITYPSQIIQVQQTEKRYTITNPALDLSALIQILEQANKEASIGEQLAIIELGLVSVELNPSPKLFVHTIHALNKLASISTTNRAWICSQAA
jgi:hypothetical protein